MWLWILQKLIPMAQDSHADDAREDDELDEDDEEEEEDLDTHF